VPPAAFQESPVLAYENTDILTDVRLTVKGPSALERADGRDGR
jgi:hypothetical protein